MPDASQMDLAEVLKNLARIQAEIGAEDRVYLEDTAWLADQLRTALADTEGFRTRLAQVCSELLVAQHRLDAALADTRRVDFLSQRYIYILPTPDDGWLVENYSLTPPSMGQGSTFRGAADAAMAATPREG